MQPNGSYLFDRGKIPVVREAFTKAWDVLSSRRTFYPEKAAIGYMRSRLAVIVLQTAPVGKLDAEAIAKAAVKEYLK